MGLTEVFSGLTDVSVKSFPLKKTSLVGAARLWWKYRWLSFRTSIMGYIIGVAPGIGANVSCWVGYDHAKSTSKEPEKFGKGSIEGLIGSETCNMANVPGAYAPVLSLAVPGDGPTAIMLGVLMIHGVKPGPTFLMTNPHWLYNITMALFIGGFLLVIIGTYAGKGLVGFLSIRLGQRWRPSWEYCVLWAPMRQYEYLRYLSCVCFWSAGNRHASPRFPNFPARIGTNPRG